MSAYPKGGPYASVHFGRASGRSILHTGDNSTLSSHEFFLSGLSAAQLRELAAQCISVAERVEAKGGAQ